ncbi:MAG: hypothetical protein NTV34_17510 [Proteobacteria bacterium]|nr:hypothetical protein [Pseudomonadota bacterium]
MPFANVETWEFDRRQLLRLTGTAGIAAFISPGELFAADICAKVSPSSVTVKAEESGRRLQYWVDGLHLMSSESNIKSRANLAVFMNLKQNAFSYVESIVLMDSEKRTMGARYFDVTHKMQGGYVPYVVFENIVLDSKQTYTVIYSVREGSKALLYTATISNPELSRLNSEFLPASFQSDFNNFSSIGNNPTPGLITTPFQYYTQNGLATHSARGHVMELGSDGTFKIDIEFMHGDAGPTHYMRYFVVMDPVGRLLGYTKRADQTVAPSGAKSDGAQFMSIQRLSDVQVKDLGLEPHQIADIRDCPYVQIFTEDAFDALSRASLRLR